MAAEGPASFHLSPLAEADLEDIWSFTVERWSWEQAQSYHRKLVDAFRALAEGRVKGRAVDVRQGYLKHSVGSHMVFYRQQKPGIEVIRILHQRMDVSRHLP